MITSGSLKYSLLNAGKMVNFNLRALGKLWVGPNSNAAPAAKLDKMFGSPLRDQPL